jgi:hypothetical protein
MDDQLRGDDAGGFAEVVDALHEWSGQTVDVQISGLASPYAIPAVLAGASGLLVPRSLEPDELAIQFKVATRSGLRSPTTWSGRAGWMHPVDARSTSPMTASRPRSDRTSKDASLLAGLPFQTSEASGDGRSRPATRRLVSPFLRAVGARCYGGRSHSRSSSDCPIEDRAIASKG